MNKLVAFVFSFLIAFSAFGKSQETCYQETEWLKQTMIFYMQGIPRNVLEQAVDDQVAGLKPNDPLTDKQAAIIKIMIDTVYTKFSSIKDPNKVLQQYYIACLSTVEAKE